MNTLLMQSHHYDENGDQDMLVGGCCCWKFDDGKVDIYILIMFKIIRCNISTERSNRIKTLHTLMFTVIQLFPVVLRQLFT